MASVATATLEDVKRGLPIVVVALAVSVLAYAAPAHAGGPGMLVGAAEDVVKQPDPVKAKAEMDLALLGGLDAIRITQVWAPGETRPSAEALKADRNVVDAAWLDGVRVFVSVLSFGSRTTPLSAQDEADFAAYAAALARGLPSVRDYIVGNEPNLNRYWLPQFNPDGSDAAAPAYEALLAETYDALKAVSPAIQVYGGAVSPRGGDRPGTGRDTHSPTVFIQDLGAAYRASGRTLPIMDAFAFHPYEDNSSAPPTSTHPATTTIALADYDKLVALLGQTFDGTAQAGSTLPILYDEFGVETQIPPAKASLYSGTEPVTTKPVDEATQVAYYRQAIQIAYCQPNVRGLFLFHVVDETGLAQWQSGLYYADGTPKLSRAAVAAAAGESRRGVVARCPGLQLRPKASVTAAGTLGCDIDCSYVARLVKLPQGGTTFVLRGGAIGGVPKELRFGRAAPGLYKITVVAVAPVNPGPPVVLASPPFTLH